MKIGTGLVRHLRFCVAAFAACAGLRLQAGDFLVVTRSADGVWSFKQADSVWLGGKEKVHRAASGENAPKQWSAKETSQAPEIALSTLTVIRRAPDGALYCRFGGVEDWHVLLPDGVKPSAPQTAAELWSRSTATIKRDRNDKAPKPVPLQELFAIVPGTDAPSLAAQVATDVTWLRPPGVSEADALQYTVKLLPEAVKAFPNTLAVERLRDWLRAAMRDRKRLWTDGDAAVNVLDEWVALAGASQIAFPDDSAQAGLRTVARNARTWLDRKVAILRVLDAGNQSDAFLLAYRDFEMFDKSFPELARARNARLRISARNHLEAGMRSHAAGDYATAIRHLRIAQWRDPGLVEAVNLLEQVRLEVARLSSQKFAEIRRGFDPRAPRQIQVQRRLSLAEQYLSDGKLSEGEQAIKDAETVDGDEPRITMLSARLAVARGDLARAVALLDYYVGLVLADREFDEAEKMRAGMQYKLDNARAGKHAELKSLFAGQRFAEALETAAGGLQLDNEDPEFLFQSGLNSCVLRQCANAAPLLRRFLDVTDSTHGARAQRVTASRLLQRAAAAAEPAAPVAGRTRTPSWFSGANLEPGVIYDPVSLAFQPKVARIKASNHLTVIYDWNGERIQSVHTKYEEKKTGSNVLGAMGAGALAVGGGVPATVGWRTPDRETNDFYFSYATDFPRVQKVSRDNVVTKSRRIPVQIPGIGVVGLLAGGGIGGLGFGGLRGFSGVGGAGALRALANTERLRSLYGERAGFSGGFAGLANLADISNGLAAMRDSVAGAPKGSSVADLARQFLPSRSYSVEADPQGGSSSGLVTLWNSPRIDTEIALAATGKRVAVGFSGNSFFHPFVWDGIHLFEFDYDEDGRVAHAWETGKPDAPRLDFVWEGRRLMKISARGGQSRGAGSYTRTLHYTGERLTSESVTYNGRSSKIDYKYDKEGKLIAADCGDDHSLDGRSRQVEFVTEAVKGDKR